MTKNVKVNIPTLTGNPELVNSGFNHPPYNPLHLLQEWLHGAEEEIGDVILTAIFLCDFCGCDVEETLKKTINKFSSRMHSMKNMTAEFGMKNLQGQPRDFVLSLWDKVKNLEKNLVT